MLAELAALSDHISLTSHELAEERERAGGMGVERVPGIVLRGPANRPVRFFGIPGGNEFPNLIDTIIDLSDTAAKVAPETAKRLKKLRDRVSITVFVTPTCPYCPAVVRTAFRLAMASAHVSASAVEIGEFPRLAQQHRVRAVPLTVLNDRVAIPGSMTEGQLVDQILKLGGATIAPEHDTAGETTALTSSPAGESTGGLVLPN
jgi:glutaredoxin-like protein